VLQVGAEYLRRVGPFFGFFGLGYALYCVGQATRRMEASVSPLCSGPPSRSRRAGGGLAKGRRHLDFIAVALGMIAFGVFALPPLINRAGYE